MKWAKKSMTDREHEAPQGFPSPLALQVIQTSNAISTMTAALVAMLVADGGHRLSRLNALLFEFRDVLPELTVVLRG
jgi:hypothetical protein